MLVESDLLNHSSRKPWSPDAGYVVAVRAKTIPRLIVSAARLSIY